MSALRRLAKALVEAGVDGSGLAALLRRRMHGRDLVLAYHNVVPDAAVRPGASGHLGLTNFASQMEAIARLADVVPVAALERPAPAGGRARVAITFDDGYRGAFRHAVPVLESLGLPATFFVCPALMGAGSFWWDAPGLDVWGRRDEVLGAMRGEGDRVRAWMREQGVAPLVADGDFEAATEDEVRHWAARPGITLGNHTLHHPNLAALGEAEVRAELAGCRDWLAARVASAIPWVAYPFGLASPLVERVAREVGCVGGFVLDGGWVPARGTSPTAIPRLNIAAGVSPRGFRLRLAGLFAR